MSRLILSSNEDWFTTLKTNIANVGFNINKEILGKQNLAVFKKFKVDNYNFYENENNWVATAGAFVYNKKIGKEALIDFLDDAKFKNIKELRKNCNGCYVIIYKLDNSICIFVDETQLFKFHYYYNNNQYILTNDAIHLYSILKPEINIPVAQCCLHIENFSAKESMFKGIERLMADECIIIDLHTNTLRIESVELNNYKYNFKSLEEAVDIIVEKIKEQAKLLKSLFKSFTIFQTGGLDSRLILSAYVNAGLKPKLINWKSNHYAMLTSFEDSVITEKIAKKLNLDYKISDLSNDFFLDYLNTNTDDLWRDGDWVCCYANNSKFKEHIYNEINTEFLDAGYFGEMYRQLNHLEEQYSQHFTLKDFVNKLFFIDDLTQKSFDDISQIRKCLYSVFLRKAISLNMDIENLSKDDCFKLWSYRRTIVDVAIPLLSNLINYSFPISAQKEIYDLLNNIPNEWKKDSHFQLAIIKNLYEDLLTIPIFSHRVPWEFNEKELKLTRLKKKRTFQVFIKKIKNSFLKKTKYRTSFPKINNMILREFIINELKTSLDYIGIHINTNKPISFSIEDFLIIHKFISNIPDEILTKKFGILKWEKQNLAFCISQYKFLLNDVNLFKYIKVKFNKNQIFYFFLKNKYLFKFSILRKTK